MTASFVDVSESETDQFKEDAVQKTKNCYKVWSQAGVSGPGGGGGRGGGGAGRRWN